VVLKRNVGEKSRGLIIKDLNKTALWNSKIRFVSYFFNNKGIPEFQPWSEKLTHDIGAI